jgi:hypothetical protein
MKITEAQHVAMLNASSLASNPRHSTRCQPFRIVYQLSHTVRVITSATETRTCTNLLSNRLLIDTSRHIPRPYQRQYAKRCILGHRFSKVLIIVGHARRTNHPACVYTTSQDYRDVIVQIDQRFTAQNPDPHITRSILLSSPQHPLSNQHIPTPLLPYTAPA